MTSHGYLVMGECEPRFVAHLSPFLHVGLSLHDLVFPFGLCHTWSCLGMYLPFADSAFGGSGIQVVQLRICEPRKRVWLEGQSSSEKPLSRPGVEMRTSSQSCQADTRGFW